MSLQHKYGWNYVWLEWTFFMFLSADKLCVVPSHSEAWVCPNIWKKWQVLQSTKIITQWVHASSMCCMNLGTLSTPWHFSKSNGYARNSLQAFERFLLPLYRNIYSHICSATNQPQIIFVSHLREKLILSQKKSGVMSKSTTPESTLYAIRMDLPWVQPQEQDPWPSAGVGREVTFPFLYSFHFYGPVTGFEAGVLCCFVKDQ